MRRGTATASEGRRRNAAKKGGRGRETRRERKHITRQSSAGLCAMNLVIHKLGRDFLPRSFTVITSRYQGGRERRRSRRIEKENAPWDPILSIFSFTSNVSLSLVSLSFCLRLCLLLSLSPSLSLFLLQNQNEMSSTRGDDEDGDHDSVIRLLKIS